MKPQFYGKELSGVDMLLDILIEYLDKEEHEDKIQDIYDDCKEREMALCQRCWEDGYLTAMKIIMDYQEMGKEFYHNLIMEKSKEYYKND